MTNDFASSLRVFKRLVFSCAYVWTLISLTACKFDPPTDEQLLDLFKTKRSILEQLANMKAEDTNISSVALSDNLDSIMSNDRALVYKKLSAQLAPDTRVSQTDGGIIRIPIAAEFPALTNDTWVKGFERIPVLSDRGGLLRKNLDDWESLPNTDIYLVPIESEWYIFFQPR